MRPSNIITAVAATLWAAMVVLGRQSTYGIFGQGEGAFPNAGQIDFGILLPGVILLFLLLSAWVCNLVKGWQGVLFAISIMSIGALLPYLAVFGGGM